MRPEWLTKFGLVVTRNTTSLWSHRDQPLVSLWPAFGLIVTSLWSQSDTNYQKYRTHETWIYYRRSGGLWRKTKGWQYRRQTPWEPVDGIGDCSRTGNRVIKRACQNEGGALRAEISQIYPKSFILCVRTQICWLLSSSVMTRHSPSKLGSALATLSVRFV